MQAVVAEPFLSLDELLAHPDYDNYEFVDGVPVEREVSLVSAEAEAALTRQLANARGDDPTVRLFSAQLAYRCFEDPDRMRRPDASIVRSARLVGRGDAGVLDIPPDFAAEVFSKNDVYRKMVEKVREYLDAGFPLVWLLDPYGRTLTTYTGDGDVAIFTESAEVTLPDLLPEWKCRVADLLPPATARDG
jgi:Uma2 family endonuclease